jgi:hypothetical protein
MCSLVDCLGGTFYLHQGGKDYSTQNTIIIIVIAERIPNLAQTQWTWVLSEKLLVVQILKNFPTFYGTRRFITVLIRASHWSVSWARWIQSILPHPISLIYIFISFYLYLGLAICLILAYPSKSYVHSCFLLCVLHAPSIPGASEASKKGSKEQLNKRNVIFYIGLWCIRRKD